MKKSIRIRTALKALRVIDSIVSEGMYMDQMMDGSGDCGHLIYESWEKWINNKVSEILGKLNLTLSELEEWVDKASEVELEKGPKQIWTYFYHKSDGSYKPKDFGDTHYVDAISLIHQFDYEDDSKLQSHGSIY